MKQFAITALTAILSKSTALADQVNVGSSYGERFGSAAFASDEIPKHNCEARTIPDCLFSMDIESILVNFNKDRGTLQGVKTTFLEHHAEDNSIVDSYSCAHGSINTGKSSDIYEIKPLPTTYVERIDVKQTEELYICELEFTFSTIFRELPLEDQRPSLV